MSHLAYILILCSISFLTGAIPSGYLLVSKFKRIDIRTVGSGNIGSTNVRRAAGNRLALATQFIDILKGCITVLIAFIIENHFWNDSNSETILSLIALLTILGHDFSPFLFFKGGKGVNTSIGAFIVIAPIPVLIGIMIYYLTRLFTPIVSIRSITLGISLPVTAFLLNSNHSIVISLCLAALLILLRHHTNINRLFHGLET